MSTGPLPPRRNPRRTPPPGGKPRDLDAGRGEPSRGGTRRRAPSGRSYPPAWVLVLVLTPLLLCGAFVLVGLLLPAVRQAQTAARRAVAGGGARGGAGPRGARDNLHAVGVGVHTYHWEEGGWPPSTPVGNIAGDGNPPVGWMTATLPYMDRGPLWNSYDRTRPFDHPANADAAGTVVTEFLHPAYGSETKPRGLAVSRWAGNVLALGPGGANHLREMRDGTTHTLLIGEVAGTPDAWADPHNLRDTAAGFGDGPGQFGGRFGGGATVFMADGSVQFLSADVDPVVFAALGTPAGGESITVDQWKRSSGAE